MARPDHSQLRLDKSIKCAASASLSSYKDECLSCLFISFEYFELSLFSSALIAVKITEHHIYLSLLPVNIGHSFNCLSNSSLHLLQSKCFIYFQQACRLGLRKMTKLDSDSEVHSGGSW